MHISASIFIVVTDRKKYHKNVIKLVYFFDTLLVKAVKVQCKSMLRLNFALLLSSFCFVFCIIIALLNIVYVIIFIY